MGDHAHLSIGEVLSLLQEEFPDVTISKIRFLESQGLIDPERTPSGYRKFYEPDIERLRWILLQQKEHFLPLKVIKDRLAERDPGTEASGVGATNPSAAPGPAPARPTDPVAAPPAAGTEGSPVPIWMADAARAAAARATEPAPSLPFGGAPGEAGARREPPEAQPATSPVAGPPSGAERRVATPLDSGPTSVSLTLAALASASGLAIGQLRELEEYGLVAGSNVGADVYYDGDALVVAQKAAGFLRHGIEPRHLRMFKVAAEREAGFLEQVVMPMVKQRNPQARQQAVITLGELAALGQSLRSALLRRALRDYLP